VHDRHSVGARGHLSFKLRQWNDTVAHPLSEGIKALMITARQMIALLQSLNEVMMSSSTRSPYRLRQLTQGGGGLRSQLS
jgi:hypothetical protein